MDLPRIFVSQLHNPYTNLALENHLLKTISQPSLFLYQNTTAVVMGRAQNPWIEVDVAFLQKNDIPLVRRQSGGGTVVHDLGNLNFSFIAPKAQFDKTAQIQLVAQSLSQLSLPVQIAERCDLLLDNKKISGSAFRETKDNCFHHGTLLVNSDLDLLRRCLQVPPHTITTRAITSRRSSVINICEALPDLNVTKVTDSLIQNFLNSHSLHSDTIFLLDHIPTDWDIQEAKARYQSENWTYNHTLPFSVQVSLADQKVTLQVEEGKITSINPTQNTLQYLIGQDYRQITISGS